LTTSRAGNEHSLGDRALATTRALAEALFATRAGPPPAERVTWLSAELDDFFAHAGTKSRWLFLLSLVSVAVVAPLLVGRVSPIRSLPLDVRTRALEKMERGSFALPLLAVKAMLCVMYYEHPDAAREIGFEAGACMLTGARGEHLRHPSAPTRPLA
jgi:hypothetical protein